MQSPNIITVLGVASMTVSMTYHASAVEVSPSMNPTTLGCYQERPSAGNSSVGVLVVYAGDQHNWRAVSNSFEIFNADAIAHEETPITEAALLAAQKWVDGLTYNDNSISLTGTGIIHGGTLIILTSSKTRRRFSVRFAPDGKFFAATAVHSNLEGNLLSESESNPESAVRWLTC